MRRHLPPLLAAAALIGLVLWAFLPRPVAVETATLARRDLAVRLDAEGEARVREVVVLSAPIAGTLHRITLHAGDRVDAGQELAMIGPAAPALLDSRARAIADATAAAAEAAVDLAQAQLVQTQAALKYARTEFRRAHALFARGALSQRLLDDAELAQDAAIAAETSARANLTVRRQELESARATLGRDTAVAGTECCIALPAPVAGRILRVLTEDEQVVQAGTPLLEIGDTADLEIGTDVLSRDAVGMSAGAKATVTDWGGPDLPGHVERIEPAARSHVSALGINEQRVKVVVALDGTPPPALGHGFRVLVRIDVWQGRNVLAVPIGALFRNGADWAVFRAIDGRAVETRIRIGARNDDFAQVLEGLQEGETVILRPDDTILDGVRISPLAPQG